MLDAPISVGTALVCASPPSLSGFPSGVAEHVAHVWILAEQNLGRRGFISAACEVVKEPTPLVLGR